jgi:hypothetical protein
VKAAIVATFQGVHHHQGDTASILTFIAWLATFLLAATGTLGFSSVSCTATGMWFFSTLAPTFVEFGLGGRWRGFAIDFDD